jgi:predicted acylesterase/phospholipase RssA
MSASSSISGGSASTSSSASSGTGQSRQPQKTKIGHKRKIAFVCSGGATKAGAFHLGVALALQEHGFRFYGGTASPSGNRIPGPMDISTYVGSSAGSIICSYLAAGYSLDNIFNSFLGRKPEEPIDPMDISPKVLPRLTYQKMFKFRSALAREQISQFTFMRNTLGKLMAGDWEALFQLQWLRATGIFSTAGLEQYLREEVLVSNRFQDCLADLFIVATQLNHSRKVVFGKYSYEPPAWDLTCQYDNDVEISQACAASVALPIIFAPYPIKNQKNHTIWYIDGEIRDTLSTHVAIDAGADLVIASYTHQPYHFLKEIGSLTDFGLPAIAIQSIYLLIEQKIKNHIFNKTIQRETINAVSKYCKDQGISEEHRQRILEIMETGLHHRMDVDTIYIHPRPDDAQMFFGEHFTLSARKMAEIVRSGFKAASETLKKYEFADRRDEPAVGTTGTD